MMMRRVEPMMFLGCTLALAALAAGCGEPGDLGIVEPPVDTAPAIPGGFRACSDGVAGDFPCSGMDLMSKLTLLEIGLTEGSVNDVWGWTDPETGTEWALVGHSQGTSFVSLDDPERPVHAGVLPLTGGAAPSIWRDIKVYGNHAFIVADGAGPHGMQVFDLTRLRSVSDPPETFVPTATYDRIHSAHNIVVNTESGFAYAVGANGGSDTCGGGLHMIDIREPASPEFAGCFADESTGRGGTGYVHDAVCVVYRGPDAEHRGREICFGSNETALSIADVSDKTSPVALASATYPDVAYSHQGWLDEEHEYLYMNDEFDEYDKGRTRTVIWDIKDLDDPVVAAEFEHSTAVSDHNLYVVGNLMYQSNYAGGLRVVDISDRENPKEVAFFDTEPDAADEPGLWGSWSNYPFFASGVIPVSSMGGGVVFVRTAQ